jgi:hypothetical protein
MPKDFAIWVRMLRKNPPGAAVAADPLDLVSREEFDVQTQVLLRTAKNWRCWSSV